MSDEVKGGVNRQVRVQKLSESEPYVEVSKQFLPVKTIGVLRLVG